MQDLKQTILLAVWMLAGIFPMAGTIEITYHFDAPAIRSTGDYQTVIFPHTTLSGQPGKPMLPYHQVVLLLPPGEGAYSVEWSGKEEVVIPGIFSLFPAQYVRPALSDPSGEFIRDEETYRSATSYPQEKTGTLITQYLHGYAFALTTCTPVNYIPATGTLSYFRKLTIRITTRPDARSEEALKNLKSAGQNTSRIASFAQNPEAVRQYPETDAPLNDYQFLIITPELFQDEFQALMDMYTAKGISSGITTTESIAATGTGWDLPEKIRNYIIGEYQNNNIEYVLLAGNPAFVPCRGFYCQVQSSSVYTDANIPADLYYSGMDGTYDASGNHIYGEVADDPDLLPEVSVARFPVNDTAELRNMIHKSISYQTNPVLEEFTQPLLAGEHLWSSPLTLGGDFMDMLIDDHADSGYFTHGIPSATNNITKLYDSIIPPGGTVWSWSAASLLTLINQGTSFIHHLGHANNSYMMRLSFASITNANFSMVNGTDHNYTFLYTQGCNTGAFDNATCIAAKAVSIDNFLAGGVFNSRYGWFNEGSSDGPSQHLEREFVSAMYTDTLPNRHLGTAHRISKVKTAPWVTAPGQWEPGALRW
ncbi:MAG: hypothetical protein HQ542_00840, partial [Bacteroidia bacterium]|nr:hypothetical protein [Bacteroidia bacterium]